MAVGVWVVCALGALCVFMEGAISASFGLEAVSLGVPLALVTYLGLRRGYHESAWALAALIVPLEWVSGCARRPVDRRRRARLLHAARARRQARRAVGHRLRRSSAAWPPPATT